MLFYDFEVFKYNWLVVIYDGNTKNQTIIWDNTDTLIKFYNNHKQDIWCGYNNKFYDVYILKGIICEFNPHEISDWIINKGRPGYQFSRLLNNVPLISYDIMTNKNMGSLKSLEGFMGNNIKESSVPFDIDRPLTEQEKEEVTRYCIHDVEQTIEVFIEQYSVFNSYINLIKTFDLPLTYLNKTQAQLAGIILEASHKKFNDEWDIRVPDNLEIHKYKEPINWFLNKENHTLDKKVISKKTGKLVFRDVAFNYDLANVPHTFGWGGIHGAIKKYKHTCDETETLVLADVDQLYPSIMLKYNLLSRGVKDKSKFQTILNTSLQLKKEGKPKERQPYKDVCNITYGAMGKAFNPLLDPLHRNLVCVYGQLFLVDLIEHIENIGELIQTNTDGILVKVKKDRVEEFKSVVQEWSNRTGLNMSFKFYKTIVQKDVNNYIVEGYDGKTKSTGAYLKKNTKIDNDLPIVKKALTEYLLHNTPIQKTINECNELIMFQKIYKLSNKFKYAYHNGKKLDGKTFRVFASVNSNDTYLGKQKEDGGTIHTYANSPKHCFIDNENIINKKVTNNLDKSYYIDLAIKRLKQFGWEVNNE